MNTTKHEKSIKQLFIGECWEYLRKNFRKFNQTNQIKIALELCKKDVPVQIEGGIAQTKIIIIRPNESKSENVAGQVCIQPEAVSGNVCRVGLREVIDHDSAGNDLQRGNPQ